MSDNTMNDFYVPETKTDIPVEPISNPETKTDIPVEPISNPETKTDIPVDPISNPETVEPENQKFTTYKAIINVAALNVRKGPGKNFPVLQTLTPDKKVYTIVEEADGDGATKWCKLKPGPGWVAKEYLTKQ